MLLAMRRASSRKHFSHVLQKIRIWVMMILSSPASSTRRNAGSEAVKVLKTHLPKVINELLCEPASMTFSTTCNGTCERSASKTFGVFRLPTRACHSKSGYWGQELRKGRLHGMCIKASFKRAQCSGIVTRS